MFALPFDGRQLAGAGHWTSPRRLGQPGFDVGQIIALAPNLEPFSDLLGVDEATVRTVLKSWGPGRFDAELSNSGKAFVLTEKTIWRDVDSARIRPGGRESAYLDRLGLGHLPGMRS